MRAILAGSALTSAFLLSGCISAPTYGTDKTATAQLLDDVSNITKLTPERKENIAYRPRPDLVKPASVRGAPLPPPQDSVADASSGAWPESPEQKRARLRAESDARNAQGPFRTAPTTTASEEISSPISTTSIDENKLGQSPRYRPGTDIVGQESRRAEFKRRLAENNQGSPTTRKYLSEPPLDYRKPAADAPADDLGEDEWKKERRLKAEARKAAGKNTSSWRDYIPGF
ncbi:MAG: hypothetical protein KF874_00635 [Rhizobiaceae bacterium]|nr:hypothetical protein [Rhizobiaceae bacterium]